MSLGQGDDGQSDNAGVIRLASRAGNLDTRRG
jgi:hypothetical protein